MLIRKLTAAALGVLLGAGLLLQPDVAWAAKSTAYYTTQKIDDHKKGDFAVLADDDVNFRAGPSSEAAILACLPRHSLFRIDGSKRGDWQKVEWNDKTGYIFADYLATPAAEALLPEDNCLGDWQLGQKFDGDAAASLGKAQKVTKDGGQQIYTFQQLQITVKRRSKQIEELTTADAAVYTMRGIGAGDNGARIVGQYGLPARVVYLQADDDGAAMLYGYDFDQDSKIGKRLDFYLNRDGDVSRIVLSNDD